MRKRNLYTYTCQTCGKVDAVYRQVQTTTPCYGCAARAVTGK
jgi:ribosomal protein S27E